MDISRESLAEFKVLYKKEFGIDLPDEEALEIAQRLLGFCLIVTQPLPRGEHSKVLQNIPFVDTGSGYLDDLNQILATKEGMLANELAQGLNDMENLRFYISAALEHPEDYLRQVYQIAQDTPLEKIKKTRGAVFAYLVKKCAPPVTCIEEDEPMH